MNERHQPNPIAPEHFKEITIERMPLEKVYFLPAFDDEEAKISSAFWIDSETGYFYTDLNEKINPDDELYPTNAIEEASRLPIMKIVLIGKDNSIKESLIADFRRLDENMLSVEDRDTEAELADYAVQIEAFISFDEVNEGEVVLSGDKSYHAALRYLADQVDAMEIEERKDKQKLSRSAELKAQPETGATGKNESSGSAKKEFLGKTALRSFLRRAGKR